MIISGLQKTTLLDYPGHVAATIFLGGCNFRCGFCHNMNLVTENLNSFDEDEILSFLKKRAGVLDGVCITGGEPTLHKDMPKLVEKIKDIDNNGGSYLVKLDTNGTNSQMVKGLIDCGLVDYIAMDIKSSFDKYNIVAGVENLNIEEIKKTINILINSEIEYEFRTTVIRQYHDDIEIQKIGQMIKGAKRCFLQSFIDSEYVPDHSLTACEVEDLNEYKSILEEYVDNVSLRGILT